MAGAASDLKHDVLHSIAYIVKMNLQLNTCVPCYDTVTMNGPRSLLVVMGSNCDCSKNTAAKTLACWTARHLAASHGFHCFHLVPDSIIGRERGRGG